MQAIQASIEPDGAAAAAVECAGWDASAVVTHPPPSRRGTVNSLGELPGDVADVGASVLQSGDDLIPAGGNHAETPPLPDFFKS